MMKLWKLIEFAKKSINFRGKRDGKVTGEEFPLCEWAIEWGPGCIMYHHHHKRNETFLFSTEKKKNENCVYVEAGKLHDIIIVRRAQALTFISQ